MNFKIMVSTQPVWLAALALSLAGGIFSCEAKKKAKIVFNTTFGKASIDKELFDFILFMLPSGKTLLELGSGWATGQFSQHYTVYSVEHDQRWIGQYASNYIYAPIKNGWYDRDILLEKLPKKYDLILVDGPPGKIGREKFYENLSLFRMDVPIVFDDVDRENEHELLGKVAQRLKREFKVFDTSSKKRFGVIFPNEGE